MVSYSGLNDRELSQIDWSGASVVFIIVLLTLSKYSIDIGNNFIPELTLTAAGAAASIPITLWVIGRAIREDKTERWAKIRKTTYLEIINYISYIAVRTPQLSIPCGLTSEKDELMKAINKKIVDALNSYLTNGYKKEDGEKAAAAMKELGDILKEARDDIVHEIEMTGGSSRGKEFTKQFIAFYDDIKFRLDVYSSTLCPRVAGFSKNTNLLDTLAEFESKSFNYQISILTLGNPLYANASGSRIIDSLIALVCSAATVFRRLVEDVEREPITATESTDS
jgi:hypothetical protein